MIAVEKKNGFTLMEVLVAVSILGLAFMVVMQNFSVSLANIGRLERAYDKDFAAMLALERLLVPGLEKDPVDGTVFVHGSRYRMVIVPPETGSRLTVMRLERIR